jgi:hypothetical protein
MAHSSRVAAQSSTLYKFLVDGATATSPWQYGLRKNVPPFVKTQKITEAVSSPTVGSEFRVNVPRYGILSGMWLTSTIVSGADSRFDVGFGAKQFSKIELRAREKTIAILYPEDIIRYVLSRPEEEFKALNEHNLLNLTNAVGSDTDMKGMCPVNKSMAVKSGSKKYTFDTCVPLPFSYLMRESNAIDTRFSEPMQLVITTAGGLTYATIAAGTMSSLEANFEFSIPSESEQKRLKDQAVKNAPMGVAKLQWSSYKEGLVSVGTTTTDIELRNPHPTFRTLVWATATAGTFLNPEITKIELKDAGVVLFTFTHQELLKKAAENGCRPLYDHIISISTNTVADPAVGSQPLMYELDYTMLKDAVDQAGFLSFKGLSNPTLTITHSGTSGKFNVVHQYYTVAAVAPQDGQVILRALS